MRTSLSRVRQTIQMINASLRAKRSLFTRSETRGSQTAFPLAIDTHLKFDAYMSMGNGLTYRLPVNAKNPQNLALH